MIDLCQKKDVLGALSLSGILSRKKLYPRTGLALSVKVGGEFKTIKGTMGSAAKIMINGVASASLTAPIADGDSIELVEAVDGCDASAKICDVIKIPAVRVILNNSVVAVKAVVAMNGTQVPLETPIVDRAQITVVPLTIRHLLQQQGFSIDDLSERQILVNINQTPRVLPQRNYTLKLNTKTVDLDASITYADVIEFSKQQPTFYRIKDVVDIPEGVDRINVTVNGKDIDMCIQKVQVFMNGHEVNPQEFLVDGADIIVYYSKQHQVLLSEIFKYVEVDSKKVLGKRMRFFVDDEPAGFTTNVSNGAQVKIIFEDRN